MQINFFNAETITRLTSLTNDTNSIADRILDHDVKIFPKLDSVQVKDLNQLWEMPFPKSPSTYSLYVYALYPVSYLLNAYEGTRRAHYLERALALANSFLEWESSNKKNISAKRNNILIGDHAVSNRTQCLCYLTVCLIHARRSVPQAIQDALLRNGHYLADNKCYSHYNHGLMMDLALLGLVNTLEGVGIPHPQHFKKHLLLRLRHSISRDLTKDGVHVENSPGYHFWMLGFLGRILKPLSALDPPIYLKALEAHESASVYANYITRPDGTVPPIGDTHAGASYRPSKGLDTRLFRDANQVVFRNSDDSVWAHFGCGYKTHVHKHCDNGSFTLHLQGQDLLVDPGFLNYENTSAAKAIKSTRFHNTAAPLGMEQAIETIDVSANGHLIEYNENLSASRILSFYQDVSFEYAVAKIADYGGTVIGRVLLWVKSAGFFIYDRCVSSKDTEIEQFFNIAGDLHFLISDSKVWIYKGRRCVFKIAPLLVDFSLPPVLTTEQSFFAAQFGTTRSIERCVVRGSGRGCLTQIDLGFGNSVSVFGTKIAFAQGNSGNRVVVDLDRILIESLEADRD